MPWRLSTFQALRHRNYRLYFFSQLVSFSGSWVQTTALQWLAYQLTEQSQWTSAMMTAAILPTCLLGGWGGVLADRIPRKTLIFTTQCLLMLQAFALTALVLWGTPTPWTLLSISLFSGIVNALDLPARLTFVVDMVGREDLVNAVALNSLLFNAARVIGPWLGGLVLTRYGPGVCFLGNGLTFLAVLAGLALMDVQPGTPRAPRAGWGAMFGGWRFLGQRPRLACLILLTGGLSVLGWPFLTLLPAAAHRVLGETASLSPSGEHGEGYSRLLTGMGSGALVAALVLASFTAKRWQRPFLTLGVVAAAGGLVGLSWSRALPLAMGFCALTGFGLVLFNATSQSIVQLSTEEGNRGQVMGVWSMVISGALPLGNQVFGPAADHLGVSPVLRIQGLGCLAAGVGVALLSLAWRPRS